MTAMTKLFTRTFVWLALCAVLLSTLLQPATIHAQSTPPSTSVPSGLQVEDRGGSLHLQWQGGVQAASTGEVPTTSYGGYLLPLQTVMVEISPEQAISGASAAVAVEGMSTSPYTGVLTPATQPVPRALEYVPTPLNTPYVEAQLPTSPIFVMNEGFQRGRHLATIGFSPIYQDPNSGQILAVENFSANVVGASVSADSDVTADPNDAALFAPVSSLAATGPTNPLANVNAYKLIVSNIGIQQLSGADLAAKGLSSPRADKIHVYYKGVELPLQIIDTNSNNTLEAGDFIRFYAFADGDIWNKDSVYWLSVGGANGLRMSARDVAPAGATARNTAHEVGKYQVNTIYQSELAGSDGDNWFQADLVAGAENDRFAVTLAHQLPLNNNLPTILTLNLTPYSVGAFGNAVLHRLRVATDDFETIDSWSNRFNGPLPFEDTVRKLTLGKAADNWAFTLLTESSGRAAKVDAIDYLLPVRLSFGDKGATFQGVDGTWRYQLSNTPTNIPGGRGLYDITNPAQPQRLNIPGTTDFEFQDGESVHRYIMTGPGTLFTPVVEPNSPVNLGGGGSAHTIYIAPKEFHGTLQPLVDLRVSQGYKVSVVDVQAIYDSWSFGMVDPKAIRSFLRFAVGTWNPAPIAAVMVGDGTRDPLNYTGYGNPNVIPPYIANADPWLKFVPCDSCYGQLDGDEPTNDYLVDIWIGRLPVIDTLELNNVVNKIKGYETDPDINALWRTTSLQLADDDVRPDNTVDTAGPFVGSAEEIVKHMPKGIRQLRNYFFAATNLDNVPKELLALLLPWQKYFEADPAVARQKSINLMNSGVGLVTYTGHSNHYHWARVVTEGFESLFSYSEVDDLRHRPAFFISLSMSCYTSQFDVPAPVHKTLDEQLFLWSQGGAVATWGPTGFSVVPAHDILQIGFHRELWKAPPLQAKLGALIKAGYQEVFAREQNLDVTKTFAMMGDPLTSARITDIETVYLPKLSRIQPAAGQ